MSTKDYTSNITLFVFIILSSVVLMQPHHAIAQKADSIDVFILPKSVRPNLPLDERGIKGLPESKKCRFYNVDFVESVLHKAERLENPCGDEPFYLEVWIDIYKEGRKIDNIAVYRNCVVYKGMPFKPQLESAEIYSMVDGKCEKQERKGWGWH